VIQWIFIEFPVERKDCLNSIHPLAFREVKFLLAPYVVSQELEINRWGYFVQSERSLGAQGDLRGQLLRCGVDPRNEHRHGDVIGCVCIVSKLQGPSFPLIQVAEKDYTIKGQNRKNEERPESQDFLPHDARFLSWCSRASGQTQKPDLIS
jgi:hypothetical protein